MDEALLSVGLDVGTTSTQMVVSRLTVHNRAGAFAVPEMEIREREILYQSPVYFTPLLEGNRMDAPALRGIVEREYERAGISRADVDTGAVIVTGETSRTENAAAVTEALADLAGNFVVAAAGPDLESVLAAKGAGAVDYSEKTGETVLHMDIGGGTSNLALIRRGEIAATGCLNVGGRLIKLDGGIITYISPVLRGIFQGAVGDRLEKEAGLRLARRLTEALEMAAGLRPSDGLLERLTTAEAEGTLPLNAPGEALTISFSGGVADCIRQPLPWERFGDLGVLLGQAIRDTVIGAGCHSTQLSGSTVFSQNVLFPLKNIPVIQSEAQRTQQEGPVFLALPGMGNPSYQQLSALAGELAQLPQPIYLCLEQDMAKALGQALALRLGTNAAILCIDRIRVRAGDYLDVGEQRGPAFPVVVKTLVLQKSET